MKKPKKYSRVLIVDDNDMDVLILKHMLKLKNFAENVVTFNFPENALFYLQELKKNQSQENFPQVIFVDMNMPGMTGVEFINQVNKTFTNSDLASCFMVGLSSGEPNKYHKLLADIPNVKKFISKPVMDKDLEI